MKKIIYLVLGVLAFVLAGCQTIDQLSPYRGLTAVIEGAQDTKTSIFPSSLSSSDVLWSDGDEIGVFIDDSLEPATFTLATGAGSKVATFTGEGNGDSYIAFYPQSMLDSRWNNTINFDLPAEQEYVLGTFADNAFPMIAASNSSQLQFKNLCSVVRISMVGSQTISKIVFTANDPSVKVSGPASVDVSASGEPKLVMDSDASNSVTLNTGNVQLSETSPTEFYFVLPPQTYKGGFTVSIYSGDVCMEKKYESDFTMVRSRLHKADLFGFEEPEVIEGIEKYLTFTSEGTSTITLVNEYGDTPVLYYSFDGENWAEWDYSELSFSTLYLSGDNPGGFNTNESLNRFSTGGSKFSVSGDIMSLIDNVNDVTEIPSRNCFAQLFLDCSNLTEAPELPATELKSGCYMSMFSGCSSLVSAPVLPATSLGDACYNAMFQWCTSLTEAPELPATEVPWNAYGFMFEGCSSLRTAPELPATDIESLAYEVMFRDCSSLTAAPALPAMTIPSMAYSSMFEGCTSLTEAPALPATTLGSQCYGNMFKGCTSLRTAPELPATDISSYSYYAMFSGCTSLTEAPELPATILAKGCYNWMFYNCTSLDEAPALPATKLAEGCYMCMFQGCSSMTTAPALPATDLEKQCYQQMFYGCTSLTEAPALPATDLAERCYAHMFNGCTSLTEAPKLPATVMVPNCYGSMFDGCTSLSKAPELPATTLANYCYMDMFGNCTSLTEAPELPATELAEGCYYTMFWNCSNLTTAPDLPAEELEPYCYRWMFEDCTNLNYVKCLATDISAENCTEDWLNGVASSGTFVKAAGMKDWTTGTSGIPAGWQVQNEGAMPEPTLEAIDLGLSVKWANFNVGAASPEDFGDYFAWGETSTKASYGSWSNYSYGNGSNDLTKYCESDGKTVLEASDDAATAELGSSWRMPTHDELQELVDECTWTWQSSGVPGYTVTGPNGNSIFLPAAAHSAGTDGFGNTVFGFYWASDINDAEGGKYRPYYLHFTSDESSITVYNNGFRPQGSPVRAVCD